MTERCDSADAAGDAGEAQGDLSRFVEEAVNREGLRETMRNIQARKADADPTEIEQMVDEELGGFRRAGWKMSHG